MPLYKSIIESARGYVVRVGLLLYFDRDAILPPFTSRVLKSILHKAGCLSDILDLYNSRRSFKPVTIRVLRTLNATPLYKVAGEGGRPITVRRGYSLAGEIVYYTRDQQLLFNAQWGGEEVDIDYARITLYTRVIEAFNLGESNLGLTGSYRITMVTPTLLTTKLMTPRSLRALKIAKLIDRAREAYRLLPTPGYILAQAARQWIAIVMDARADESWIPYSIGRLGDILVAETGYKIKPITVIYGKGSGSSLRLVKGVTGYIELEALHKSIIHVMDKLLLFINHLGLGKSRSIGFGEVRVNALDK